MSAEDDTYSTVFLALKHPIRRKILRRLNATSSSYTDLLNEMGIENGLLNYHLESMQELIRKQENGSYTLSEFGKAGLSLIQRIEEPIIAETGRSKETRFLTLQILAFILIIILSMSTWSFYSSNQTMMSTIGEQKNRIESQEDIIQGYKSLFDSNITTPISKIEAIAKALSRDRWNSSTLGGMKIVASLKYVEFYKSPTRTTYGFHFLGDVNEPVNDYSPMIEYNVTSDLSGNPIEKGTLWRRYVWSVVVYEIGTYHGIPPTGLYWVDASTGEMFRYNGLSIEPF